MLTSVATGCSDWLAMNRFEEVIDKFGGPRGFAQAVGIPESHARTMLARKSIPVEHWRAVVAAAEDKRLPISYELLTLMAERRRESSGKEAAA